ncbi:MAG TPA: alpha-amylase [Cyanothece sp. UBA12306]|nr:alpha-amylase [Cyanothece sp. UBA12306]
MKWKKILFQSVFYLLLIILLITWSPAVAYSQAGFGDNRVMLQGFYWESYRHGHPQQFPNYGSTPWYEIVEREAPEIREGRFDLIWLPPPSYAGDVDENYQITDHSNMAGYAPKEYFNLNNAYGTHQQQRQMLEALLNNGIEPVADIIINHRNGSQGWANFKNPDWGTWSITRDDEAFTDPRSEVYNTPIEQRGNPEETTEYDHLGTTTYAYGSYRDIDHTNSTVRRDIIRYLLQLKSLGYRGWRYDMVHGYHAKRLATYNRASNPTFSVGEYDWGRQPQSRGWVWHSATQPGNLKTGSSVFDFSTKSTLQGNKTNYRAWYSPANKGIGLVGDTTDGHSWKNKAVTFLENHDTGYRTNEFGEPEKDNNNNNKVDSFANNWEVEQGYAYILTHPGVPTVFWKHYFDWGPDLHNKITALINARKVAGVNANSTIHTQNNARDQGVYGAFITGTNGDLYVRIGGSDQNWQPYYSGYQDYREYAKGNGWKVWVKLPGNPPVKQARYSQSLPIPQEQTPDNIQVPDSWLD